MKIALRPCFNPPIVKTNSGNCSSSSPNVETEKVHTKKKNNNKRLNKRLLEKRNDKFLKLLKKCKTPKKKPTE